MFTYQSFGLTISSEMQIPNFVPTASSIRTDVSIQFGGFEIPQGKLTGLSREMLFHRKGILMYWKDIGAFLIEEGKLVSIAITTEKTRFGMVQAVLSGPVMGVLLYQRGIYSVFHASAAAREDGLGAVSFLAQKGGGKSSMTTAMINSGYSLVSDDLLAVRYENGCPLIQPGFPGLKLWEDAALSLVEEGRDLPMVGEKDKYEKRLHRLDGKFISREIPLHSIFVLEYSKEDKVQIIPLTQKEALAHTMLHWYGANFLGQLLPLLGVERHFREGAALAKNARIYRLVRPRDLSRIDDVVMAVDRFRKGH